MATLAAIERDATGQRASGFWRRYTRNWLVVAASVFLVLVAVVAIIGPAFLDPFAFSDVTYGSPSWTHPMGTDHLGRDILAQVVFGARSALFVGLWAALLAALLGTLIGALAGYFGGLVDGALMRATDVMLSVPTFFIALLAGILFGSGLLLISSVMGLTIWTGTARVVRAEILTQKERGYVEAARAIGASQWHLLFVEVLPNSVHPAIALISLSAAWAILAEAGLSFLGLRDPQVVTYGWMLNVALDHYTSAWWMAVFPGLALSLIVLALNLVGDGINDARNPRVREGRARRRTALPTETPNPALQPGESPLALEVSHLCVDLPIGGETARIVDDISLEVRPGEIVGLVGESGSGKTMTALAVVGLIPTPGYVAAGRVEVAGQRMNGVSDRRAAYLRARTVAMSFQDPQSSLNPVMQVGRQIADAIVASGADPSTAWREAVSAMEAMRIPAAHRRAHAYPHELSGGMRQRVLLAMALVREPKLLILDEPTTALDVITQREIVDLVGSMVQGRGLGVLLITHDFSVVAEVCVRVHVMYAGRLVEGARTSALIRSARHPYSQGLIKSIPTVLEGGRRLAAIPGSVPQVLQMPDGCRFHPRCPAVMAQCRVEQPPDFGDSDHSAACWLEADRPPGVRPVDVWQAEASP